MTHPTNKIIRKNPDVCVTTLDGELVVMNTQSSIYYRINLTGSRIWDIVNSQGCRVHEILEGIAEYYHLPAKKIRADDELFISLMLKKELFQLVEAA